MRIRGVTADGKPFSYRPEDILEEMANRDGQTRAGFLAELRQAFPGNDAEWYDDVTDQWCGPE